MPVGCQQDPSRMPTTRFNDEYQDWDERRTTSDLHFSIYRASPKGTVNVGLSVNDN